MKHMAQPTAFCTCLKNNFDELITEHLEEVAEYIRKEHDEHEKHEHEHERTAHDTVPANAILDKITTWFSWSRGDS